MDRGASGRQQRGAPTDAQTPFGGEPAAIVVRPVHPPRMPIFAAAVVVASSLSLLPTGRELLHAYGWFAGSVLNIVLLGLYVAGDQRARRSALYSPVAALDRGRSALAVIGFSAALYHAWYLARSLAGG